MRPASGFPSPGREGRRPAKTPAARSGDLHAGSDTLADQRGVQLRHGTHDRERGTTHGAGRVDLVLNADEPYAKTIEPFESRKQIAHGAGALPDEDAVDLAIADTGHPDL